MKRLLLPLLLLFGAACGDVSGPAAPAPAAAPAAADETMAVLAAAMADELFASGQMNTVGVLSEGRTPDAAVVFFSNPTRSVRYQFRRVDGRWSRAESIGPQLAITAAGGPSFATAYAPRIAEVYRTSGGGTVHFENLYAAASGSSGDFVTNSAIDALQRLNITHFYAGSQTVNDTIFSVDLNKLRFYHELGGVNTYGECLTYSCTTQVYVQGLWVNSKQVSAHYHLRVNAPVTISAISGPDSVAWQGYVTWSASASGGAAEDPAHTFEWQISFNGGSTWTGVGTGASSYTRHLNTTNHGTFHLRVRASRSGRTSPWSAAKRVGVASPLYPALSVEIDGENVLTTQNSYTWTAQPVGGTGTYSYQWYVIWDGAPYHTDGPLGTSVTQSMSVIPEDGNFSLRVVVTSGGQTAEDLFYVTNLMTCGEDYCEVDP